MATGTVKVDPAELNASAAALDGIADDLKVSADEAVKRTDEAVTSLAGWSITGMLGAASGSWRIALTNLQGSVTGNAGALRTTAAAHTRTDEGNARGFRGAANGMRAE